MITEVSEKNGSPIPSHFASEHGTKPGGRLDWKETDCPNVITGKILPDYAALASSLMGAGKKHVKPGVAPIENVLLPFERTLPAGKAKKRE